MSAHDELVYGAERDPAPLLADSDAEKGVIGCMLSGDEWVSKAASQVRPEAFFDPLNRTIFTILSENDSADQARLLIDFKKVKCGFSVSDALMRVNECIDLIPSPSNLPHYVEPVAEYARRRELQESLSKAQVGLRDGLGFSEIMSGMDSLFTDEDASERSKEEHKEQVLDLINHIEKCQAGEISPLGCPTGFYDLDTMTRGIHPGDMFVVAARPGVGKSTFGLNVAAHAAMSAGKGVMFFSLEMDARQLHMRVTANRTGIELRQLETKGSLSEADVKRVMSATNKLHTSNFRIYDRPGMNLFDIRAICRSACRERDVDLVVIDYLQLVHMPGFRPSDREREVAAISTGIKALARELGVGFLVLAQVNRESQRADRRPKMSEIRESGAVEQDSDAVAILHQPDPEDNEVRLYLDKQRNGDTGMVKLRFKKTINRFEEEGPFSDH